MHLHFIPQLGIFALPKSSSAKISIDIASWCNFFCFPFGAAVVDGMYEKTPNSDRIKTGSLEQMIKKNWSALM
jgi:hypothetical protein